MLKFEDKFTVGEKIRAYDYNPKRMPEGTHVYFDGVITGFMDFNGGWSGSVPAYKTNCYHCTHMKRAGEVAPAPLEIYSNEFDDRVQSIPVLFLKSLIGSKDNRVFERSNFKIEIKPEFVNRIEDMKWLKDIHDISDVMIAVVTEFKNGVVVSQTPLPTLCFYTSFYNHDLDAWVIPIANGNDFFIELYDDADEKIDHKFIF